MGKIEIKQDVRLPQFSPASDLVYGTITCMDCPSEVNIVSGGAICTCPFCNAQYQMNGNDIGSEVVQVRKGK